MPRLGGCQKRKPDQLAYRRETRKVIILAPRQKRTCILSSLPFVELDKCQVPRR